MLLHVPTCMCVIYKYICKYTYTNLYIKILSVYQLILLIWKYLEVIFTIFYIKLNIDFKEVQFSQHSRYYKRKRKTNDKTKHSPWISFSFRLSYPHFVFITFSFPFFNPIYLWWKFYFYQIVMISPWRLILIIYFLQRL